MKLQILFIMVGNNQKLWDIAVIGGGPAGMMAAGRAAELGAKVILIEKTIRLEKTSPYRRRPMQSH